MIGFLRPVGIPVVSLFSGAGGLDHGFSASGYDVRVSIELDRDCCETLRLNRTGGLVINDGVENVPSEYLTEKFSLDTGGEFVMVGGPPCQPFSKSAYWSLGDTKRLEDPRANTLFEYLRLISEMQPKVFLLENVAGLAFNGKDEGYKLICKKIQEINREKGTRYKLSYKLINMVEYGVPQIRERFFIVGHREGLEFTFPKKTHVKPDEMRSAQLDLSHEGMLPFNSAWDAIGDLADPLSTEKLDVGGKWADLLPSIPEGENYLWHTDRKGGLPLFGWRRRYWGFLLKLSKELPSWTIQAQPGSSIGPFHWTNRRLSIAELCRLMTFPDISIYGGRTSIQRQLGNAVPSLMTEILSREILKQFYSQHITSPLRLMPVKKGTTPPPEKVEPVPSKYLYLVGDHSPHPGTGKGRIASLRRSAA